MTAPAPANHSPRARVVLLSVGCLLVGAAMAGAAKVIAWLIAVITNVSFFHRLSAEPAVAAAHTLGPWVFIVPAIGGLIVGLMARFGSRAIQGHGIPEAMEQVLLNGSRIPPKVLLLKPLSTSFVIGTGGPFGIEGVVIATGGALGSYFGQIFKMTPLERKTLLAAGAAAGLSAAFAAPVSAVMLAVELLLFEFHPRSLIPVALASAAAAALRVPLLGAGPIFSIPALGGVSAASLPSYLAIGLAAGLLSIVVVDVVHRVETAIERVPIHWMWKPALGGLGVGLLALIEPRVLGPGYGDIESMLRGAYGAGGAFRLGLLKLVAWVIGVGSATSSGTLAPLLLIGSAVGALCSHALPAMLDPRVAALAGMAAFFGGISGAFLASVMIAFEATYQPAVLMPVLAAAATAYLVTRLFSRENIMTQKFVRRGVAVPAGFIADPLDRIQVAQAAAAPSHVFASDMLASRASLPAGESILPVTDPQGRFIGFLKASTLETARSSDRPLADLVEATGAMVVESATLREATERMLQQEVDRLAVVSGDEHGRLVGIVTERAILAAYGLEERGLETPTRVPAT